MVRFYLVFLQIRTLQILRLRDSDGRSKFRNKEAQTNVD